MYLKIINKKIRLQFKGCYLKQVLYAGQMVKLYSM